MMYLAFLFQVNRHNHWLPFLCLSSSLVPHQGVAVRIIVPEPGVNIQCLDITPPHVVPEPEAIGAVASETVAKQPCLVTFFSWIGGFQIQEHP